MKTEASGEVQVSAAPRIARLRFRLLRDDDYPPLATLIAEAHVADHVEWIPDDRTLRVEWENLPDFDPRRDVVVAEIDGRIVAFGRRFREMRDESAVYMAEGSVHPDARRRGIGRAILHHNEACLREIASRHEDPGGREFGSWAADGSVGARALLDAEGYRPVRFGFAMRRPTLEELPDAPLPVGLEIRPVDESQHRAIFDADNEAFRDHWGHREQLEEDYRFIFGHPDLDTRLWRVAWDGDEVAGSVWTFIFPAENDKLGVKRGWLARISVRRPWRRRGVARAIIVSAMEGLRDAGMTEAMLGVDAENPSGALRLYETLGFAVHDRGASYRKAW